MHTCTAYPLATSFHSLTLLSVSSIAVFRFLALLRLLACLSPPVSLHSAYAVAGGLICLLQTCAILETVHAAIGLVPTAPLLDFMQLGGRTHFVLAVVRQFPEVQSSPSVFITFWLGAYLSVDYVPSSSICEGEEPLLKTSLGSLAMSCHSFLVALLVCYPFLRLKLYLHMFKQRKSKLGKVDRKKRA